jgi:hypothetical protein
VSSWHRYPEEVGSSEAQDTYRETVLPKQTRHAPAEKNIDVVALQEGELSSIGHRLLTTW